MDKGFENFNALNTEATDAPVAPVDERKAKKKAKLAEMAEVFKATINNDPTFTSKLRTLSNSVKVVNTLGFGESGGLLADENKKNANDDKQTRSDLLVPTSQIVGYRIQNIGDTPINYNTEEYAPNELGVFVGTRVQKTLEPGGIADLTRKFMTVFCSQPEISFKLENGKIVRGSSTVKPGDVDAELGAYYFSFDDKSLKVNSDEIKINVGKRVKAGDTTKWVVKKEYEATFGFLNNEKSAAKKPRAKKSSYTAQDLTANYIQKLLQETGKM